MAINQDFREFAGKRCEEILREFKTEKRNELCRKYQSLKVELSVEVAELIDDYIEQLNVLESEKEDYLYAKAFIDGLTLHR